MSWTGIIAIVAAGAASAILCRTLLRHRSLAGRMDEPNERSLHTVPTPRTGGLGVLFGVFVGWVCLSLAGVHVSPALWIGVVTLGALSLADDFVELPAWLRFVAHGLVAVLLIGVEGSVQQLALGGFHSMDLGLLGPVLTFLFVVWMINLYNFMDGMDGLAASMAITGFGALSVAAALSGMAALALPAAVVVTAAAGFLLFNFPPARMFMGDVGSTTLGLTAAAMSLEAARVPELPWYVGVLAFAPFIVDATWTLLRRMLAREPFWRPHRSHHYQRLVLAGWSPRRVLGWALSLMLVTDGIALCLAFDFGDPVLLGTALVGLYAGAHIGVSRVERGKAVFRSRVSR